MKTLFLKLTAIAIFSQNLTACGTIISLSEGDYSAYAGVSKDFKAIQSGGILSIPAVVDLPLSFVLDTLMLPVTLNQ
ncbi:YceK/YidQ family lipoprotein [Actinobacillus suis]|uniref:Lipoprotein n=2 Tax=Actinobacillus suis TaxID=716 RepID=K0G3M5_ACTSU|nr:YceK/YidQ family lipoprotein [Actinobacillus suis]AFU18718.1 hypothetical protein ASU2_02890 [Actinobacillus suis H91-0380]AIJ30796.1 hypothetical protein ASU1_02610 [Actinobacillus suis ATCC 33415]MCO4167048.1 YceK/YidQ family lipoprotein [Actinobacillus suis]MCO4168426.1 YceK/YidQ family lipoprotein [Actinobacillus suis]MCQ9629069.1 YceK/YidQ family lipoprotein [Actinobacillus suis]